MEVLRWRTVGRHNLPFRTRRILATRYTNEARWCKWIVPMEQLPLHPTLRLAFDEFRAAQDVANFHRPNSGSC